MSASADALCSRAPVIGKPKTECLFPQIRPIGIPDRRPPRSPRPLFDRPQTPRLGRERPRPDRGGSDATAVRYRSCSKLADTRDWNNTRTCSWAEVEPRKTRRARKVKAANQRVEGLPADETGLFRAFRVFRGSSLERRRRSKTARMLH